MAKLLIPTSDEEFVLLKPWKVQIPTGSWGAYAELRDLATVQGHPEVAILPVGTRLRPTNYHNTQLKLRSVIPGYKRKPWFWALYTDLRTVEAEVVSPGLQLDGIEMKASADEIVPVGIALGEGLGMYLDTQMLANLEQTLDKYGYKISYK